MNGVWNRGRPGRIHYERPPEGCAPQCLTGLGPGAQLLRADDGLSGTGTAFFCSKPANKTGVFLYHTLDLRPWIAPHEPRFCLALPLLAKIA